MVSPARRRVKLKSNSSKPRAGTEFETRFMTTVTRPSEAKFDGRPSQAKLNLETVL